MNLLVSGLFLMGFLFSSCAPIPQKKKAVPRIILPLSIQLKREISMYLIQQPDQVMEVQVFLLKGKKDILLTKQNVSPIKIPTLLRLQIKEDKEVKRPTYTVKVKLKVDEKNRFKGLIIIPHWRNIDSPLEIMLRRD